MISTCCLAATAELSLRPVPWPTIKRLVSDSGTPGAASWARWSSNSVMAEVIAHGFAVFPFLAAEIMAHGHGCGQRLQTQFARDNGLREISFTDKIGHDVHFADHGCVVEEKSGGGIAHGRLFFPETARHLPEETAPADGGGVREARRAGVRVGRGTVADDQKRRVQSPG